MKSVLILVLMVFLFVGGVGASDELIVDETIYKVSATVTGLGTAASSTNLIRLPLGGKAGFITSIKADSDNSDDHDLYLFNQDISTWYSNKSDKTTEIYFYASSVTDWVDNDIISFTAPNGSIYLGSYNGDASLSATLKYDIEYKLNHYVDKGDNQ